MPAKSGNSRCKVRTGSTWRTTKSRLPCRKVRHHPRAFVAYLQGPAGRPVIDETGWKGYYAFDLEWTRDPQDRKNAGILSTLGKIGLKLEPQKKTYDVLVIDKASKEPTGN